MGVSTRKFDYLWIPKKVKKNTRNTHLQIASHLTNENTNISLKSKANFVRFSELNPAQPSNSKNSKKSPESTKKNKVPIEVLIRTPSVALSKKYHSPQLMATKKKQGSI